MREGTALERTQNEKKGFGITSFVLHTIAMALMLCDHLWATVVPGADWLTWLGRLAFPLFAFMLAEGYFYTKDFRKYLLRMVFFALLSEIPFNLTYTTLFIYPFQQNVLWTFLLALLCMKAVDKMRGKMIWYVALPVGLLVTGGFMLAAQLLMTDYGSWGLGMVMLFYAFHRQGPFSAVLGERKWLRMAGQLCGMVFINFFMIKGITVPVSLFRWTFELPRQGAAVLALGIIWLYGGERGYYNRTVKWVNYLFYPVHMLVLGLLMRFWM